MDSSFINNDTEQKKDEALTRFIDILNSSSTEIEQTLNVIKNVSSQTNMLSINAAVVASRSNDSRGEFNVIAQEIHKLSEHSKDSANKIQDLLAKMNNDIKDAYDQVNELKREQLVRQNLESSLNMEKVQNQLFIEILDHVGNKVEVKGPAGKFYLINQAVADDYGKKSAEILGKDDFEFFDYETAKGYWDSEKKIIENRKDIISLEKVVMNGEDRFWLIKKIPILIPEYDDWGLLIVQRSIDPYQASNEAYLEKLKKQYPQIELMHLES